jgi:hypothetical protein
VAVVPVSVVTSYTIRCDGKDGQSCHHEIGPGTLREIDELWKVATRNDCWIKDGDRHLCSECNGIADKVRADTLRNLKYSPA